MSHRGQKQTMSLLVRNLKFQTSPDKIREVFEKFGSIRDVYIPLEFHSKKPRGFGFVEYYDKRDGEAALREMDNYEIDGNRIEVTVAQRGRSDPGQMRHRETRNRGEVRSRRRYSQSPSYERGRYRSRSPSYHRNRGARRSPYSDHYRPYNRSRSSNMHRYKVHPASPSPDYHSNGKSPYSAPSSHHSEVHRKRRSRF